MEGRTKNDLSVMKKNDQGLFAERKRVANSPFSFCFFWVFAPCSSPIGLQIVRVLLGHVVFGGASRIAAERIGDVEFH